MDNTRTLDPENPLNLKNVATLMIAESEEVGNEGLVIVTKWDPQISEEDEVPESYQVMDRVLGETLAKWAAESELATGQPALVDMIGTAH